MAFALLTITATAVSTLTVESLSQQRSTAALRERAHWTAERLQRQLAPALSRGDRAAVAQLLGSYASAPEIEGIALYTEGGSLIEGRGMYPQNLSNSNHSLEVTAVGPNDVGVSHVYLSLTNGWPGAQRRWDAEIAACIGVALVLCALFVAQQLAGRIENRLRRIVRAAQGMASGEVSAENIDDRADDAIGAVSGAFNAMILEFNRLAAEHELQVITERERLEALVTERTSALERKREMFRLMAESTRAMPFTLDLATGAFTYIGSLVESNTGIAESEWSEPGALDILIPRHSNPEVRQGFDACTQGLFEFVAPLMLKSTGNRREMRWTGTCEVTGQTKLLRGLIVDVTEFRRMAKELSAAQKLESVGRLAAGVAHEINTPVQFVTDNVNFVGEAMSGLATVIEAYRVFKDTIRAGGDPVRAVHASDKAEQSVDLDYLLREAPLAVRGSLDGLQRIANIVRSMKAFAHPDQAEKVMADINQAIESTLIMAANEYKYVATVETHFGDLPPIQCYLGEINQAVLNLIVNASHAIADVHKVTGVLGKITVQTRIISDQVEISVADTGGGIPLAVRDKLFDPFFTTKEVGKGTGQGLAIAHSVVIKKHGGTLTFDTEIGQGTTFYIRIPIAAPVGTQAAAA